MRCMHPAPCCFSLLQSALSPSVTTGWEACSYISPIKGCHRVSPLLAVRRTQGNTNLKLHDDDDRRPAVGATGKAAAGAAAGVPLAVPPLTAPTPTAGSRATAPSTPMKEPDSGGLLLAR